MKIMAWVHLGLAIVWIILVYPTLRWWRESVLWVALMSIYAIIVSHLAAMEAANAVGP